MTTKLYQKIIILTLCFICLPISLLGASWETVLSGSANIDSILDSLPADELDNLESDLINCTDSDCKAKTQIKLGAFLVAMKQPQKAIPLLKSAIDLSDNSTLITFAKLTLGRALVHTRETTESEIILKSALSSAQNQQQYLWAGDAGIALSVIKRWQMNLDDALKCREDALVNYQKAEYLKGQARSLHYIANIYALQGNLIKATRLLEDALIIAKQTGATVEIAGCLSDLANISVLTGNPEQAILQYEEAANITPSTWQKGFIQINIGSLYLSSEKYPQAVEWFDLALEQMRLTGDVHNEAEILQGIGVTLSEMEKPLEGIKHLNQSIEIAEKYELPMTESFARHFKGAILIKLNDVKRAKQELEIAYSIAEKIEYFELLESCLRELAKAERMSGNNQKALQYLEKSISLVTGVRQSNKASSTIASGYFSTTGRTFSDAIDLLWDLHLSNPDSGHDLKAFNFAQQAKARSLLDMLNDSDKIIPKPIDITEVQNSVLDSGELLLEYHVGEKTSFLWVVNKNKLGFKKIETESLEENIQQFLPMLSDYNLLGDDPSWFNLIGGKLTQQLVGEFMPDILSADRIIISADGVLNNLPFEALPLSNEKSFGAIDYLITKTEVTYTPSISALTALRCGKPVNHNGKSLLMGDPVLTEETNLYPKLDPLPFASSEVDKINLLLGTTNKVFLKDAANKTNLYSSIDSYRYVHFATHGVFNEESPMYSGLILSPDHELDNFLSLTDIFEMTLPCEMVTLSACSSALGDNVTGEGVVGLTRGFIYAGAQSVCSTLWDVSGESTSEFMVDFYKLLALDIGKSTALAKTKRLMIANKETAHPFFWGAFVLSGKN